MKKITGIAIEDEAPAIDLLESYLEHFPQFELKAYFVSAFEARSFLKEEKVDVLFLDIQLPGISGMEFLKILENPPLVVITSAYDEHAIEAFGLEVFDYLLKPYSLVRFTKTMDRIERQFSKEILAKPSTITLQEGRSIRKITLEDVEYIESQREYLIFYLSTDPSVKTRMTMEEGKSLFPEGSLIRIHRSFMVPKNKIISISAHEVTTAHGSLPIGRLYRQNLMDKWTKE